MNTIKVYSADDHEINSLGLKTQLSGFNDVSDSVKIDLIGSTVYQDEFIKACKRDIADIYVSDLGFESDLGDLGVIHNLKNANPKAKIIVLSSRESIYTMIGAIRAGALGYVTKTNALEFLTDAIQEVYKYNEKIYTMPGVMEKIGLTNFYDPLEGLTDREKTVFMALAHGATMSAVAKNMKLSRKSIEYIIASKIKPLFNLTSTEIRPRAAEMGLIDPIRA